MKKARHEVRDRGLFMQMLTNAMTYELPNDRESLIFNTRLDGTGDVIHPMSIHGLLNAQLKRLLRHIKQPLFLFGDLAHRKGERTITVISVFLDSDINRNDLTLFENPLSRHSVDYLFIDAHAERVGVDLGINFVAFECWLCASRTDKILGDRIKLQRYSTRHHVLLKVTQHVGYDPACCFDLQDRFHVMDGDTNVDRGHRR